MKTRLERRKLTFKTIRKNLHRHSKDELPEKVEKQPHRLYKGRSPKNKPETFPSKRDLKNDLTAKEELKEN